MAYELNKTEQALCALLRASLFGDSASLPEEIDPSAVLHEAKCQAVAGLIALPELESVYQQNLAKGLRILYGQNQLISLLEAHQIPLVILKGTAAAVYYPEPLRRSMGDIDFIVPQDCIGKAIHLMEQNGYQKISEDSRHIGFQKGGLELELHHCFSYPDLDIEDFITDGLTHLEYGEIGGNRFPMLPRLANGMVLLAHLRCHLQTGVGLRQVIDWMMYVNNELDDDFWQCEFRRAASSREIEKLAITVTRMCQLYLGLSDRFTWCASADDKLCDQLIELLFVSGNFGRKNEKGNDVETVSTRIRSMGLFHYLQSAGETHWEAYHRHPYLKPFCWLYQFFRIIKRGLETRRGMKIMEDLDRSKDRYELLKELSVL